MTKHVTIELTEDQLARLDVLAMHKGSPVESLILEAVEQVLGYDAWYREMVQEGLDSADRGELVSHEQVVAEMQQLRAELSARKAAE
jgi:predicted transcriptional regulator